MASKWKFPPGTTCAYVSPRENLIAKNSVQYTMYGQKIAMTRTDVYASSYVS